MPPTAISDTTFALPASSGKSESQRARPREGWQGPLALLAALAAGVAIGGMATQAIWREMSGAAVRPSETAVLKPQKPGVAAVVTPVVATGRSRASFPKRLSEFALFVGELSDLQPAKEVIEYQLNTPLFTDYAEKQRLIKLPEGTAASYTADGPLDFPVGTVIAKTFYYPADMTAPAGERPGERRIVETRILEHRADGWVGIPYVWNDEQTDAMLALTGGETEVSWVHTDGELRQNVHLVPNFNDCKRCHATPTMQPLGPKARNLNRDMVAGDGSAEVMNQLAAWAAAGRLVGLPEPAEVPRLADWGDPHSGSVDERARAYLDVNCAHCHSAEGPARNSGLHLDVATADPYRLGVFKTPVAAGRGTGGRLYGIVPGKPHESILHYRIETTRAGEMMPEFGRSLVHTEGLALITEWIEGIESPE